MLYCDREAKSPIITSEFIYTPNSIGRAQLITKELAKLEENQNYQKIIVCLMAISIGLCFAWNSVLSWFVVVKILFYQRKKNSEFTIEMVA